MQVYLGIKGLRIKTLSQRVFTIAVSKKSYVAVFRYHFKCHLISGDLEIYIQAKYKVLFFAVIPVTAYIPDSAGNAITIVCQDVFFQNTTVESR